MTTAQVHFINSEPLTSFKSIEDELILDKNKNYLFDLGHLSVIDVQGDKSAEFLQGQLTCDINRINTTAMLPGAQCNLKGRILALMDVLFWNGFKLIIPKSLEAETINTLAKPAMLSRVTVKANPSLQVFGFLLQNQEDTLPKHFNAASAVYEVNTNSTCQYYLGDGFYIIVSSQEDSIHLKQLFSNQELGSLAWHTFMLRHLRMQIYPESRGLFLPQRLQLDKTDYVSFNKGCYKGQEIIARMYYKSVSKHVVKLYDISSHAIPKSGTRLLKIDTQAEFGEIIDYSILGKNRYLICVSHLNEAISEVMMEHEQEIITLREPG